MSPTLYGWTFFGIFLVVVPACAAQGDASEGFTWGPAAPTDLDIVSFSTSVLDAGVQSWDFGDGKSSHARSPHHRFSPGDHVVTLVVESSTGTETFQQIVHVEAAPDASTGGPSRGYVQPLIDQTPPGGTVRLISGRYPESVIIEKPLTIEGVDSVIIDGGGEPAVVVVSPGVVLRGLTLQSFDFAMVLEDAPVVDVVEVRLESGSSWSADNVGWVRFENDPPYDPPTGFLLGSNAVHSHPLEVRLLDSSGAPRRGASASIYDGDAPLRPVTTDNDGRALVVVAHRWSNDSFQEENRTELVLADGARFVLDSHARSMTLRPAAASTLALPPMILIPSMAALLAVILGAAAFRFHEGFRWRWLLLFAPLFTRFARAEVLDHDARGTIYGYVESNPGAHLRAIKRDLSLKHGTLIHHLNMLEDHGFLKSARDGMYRRYFVRGTAPRFEGADPTAQRVLDHIRQNPGATNLAIATALEKRPSLIHYHVQRLVEQGAVRKEGSGRETHLHPLERGPSSAS